MEEAEIFDLLRKAFGTPPTDPAGRVQIVINGPILIGTDVGTLTGLKLLLRAYNAAREEPEPPMARPKAV